MHTHPPERPGAPEPGAAEQRRGRGRSRWVGRLGFAAFMFFLIKGLAWLCVPAALAALAMKD